MAPENSRQVKVLEFRFNPTPRQVEIIRQWQKSLRYFWNYALAELLRYEKYTYGYKKVGTAPAGRSLKSDLPWRYYSIPIEEKDPSQPDKKTQLIPYCPLVDDSSRWIVANCAIAKQYTLGKDESPREKLATLDPSRHVLTTAKPSTSERWANGWLGGWGYSCAIGDSIAVDENLQPINPPNVMSPSMNAPKKARALNLLGVDKGLHLWVKDPEALKIIKKVPAKYRMGTLALLSTSWQEYEKSKFGQNDLGRGRPKFKGRHHSIATVIHPNPNAGQSKPHTADPVRLVGENTIQIPGLGRAEIPNLDARWGDNAERRIKTFKILETANGWFIQLTGDFDRAKGGYTRTHGFIGIDTGWKEENWITSDRGAWKKPRWERMSEEKKSRLLREIDRKMDARLILWLGHPQVDEDVIKSASPHLSAEARRELKRCRTIEQVRQLIGDGVLTGSAFQRLRHRATFPGDKQPFSKSRGIMKLRKQVAKLNRKNKLRRRSHIQKTTTWLARKYDAIGVEDGLQNIKGKAKAKVSEDGQSFDRNNRSQNRGANKSHLDASIGDLIGKLERKAEAYGRKFEKVKPGKDKAPSQTCPVCGHRNAGQKEIGNAPDFNCEACGYHHRDRDVVPGINFAIWAFEKGEVPRDKLSKEARQALRLRESRDRESRARPTTEKKSGRSPKKPT
ncbi:MAG: zinc ribbon domain-containing protein [Limnospira sp.]